jgi:hypothetical protein
MPLLLVVVAILFLSPIAEARTWERIPVEGARCGDGSPYSVFLSRGNSRKIVFDFMGGGACWSEFSCFGTFALTKLSMGSKMRKQVFLSDSKRVSPAAGDTVFVFPYCTGDVQLGTHVVKYGNRSVNHVGRTNVEYVVQHFTELTGLSWDFDRVVLYGDSAGAIAALHHVQTFAPYIPASAEKVVLSDSPGLHFGPRMWKKFPPELIEDYDRALRESGRALDRLDGNVAVTVPDHCKLFPDWRFGVMQGSYDVVMSLIFGNSTPCKQDELIFSDSGVFRLTDDPTDNCSAWVPRTPMHTFFVKPLAGQIRAGGLSALGYARRIIEGRAEDDELWPNYR